MSEPIDLETFKRALEECGVPAPNYARWTEILYAQYRDGSRVSTPIFGKKLGNCYHRLHSLTLGTDEALVPKGNGGNYRVLERGEHPILGPWIKTSCEVDSGD